MFDHTAKAESAYSTARARPHLQIGNGVKIGWNEPNQMMRAVPAVPIAPSPLWRPPMFRTLTLVALLSTVSIAPGCVAAAVGAAALGTIEYVRNEASREYQADLEATWSATLQGLRDLAYPVDPSVRYGQDGGSLEINDVTVTVQSSATGRTRLTIRIGTFDSPEHRVRAKNILDAVGRRLGA